VFYIHPSLPTTSISPTWLLGISSSGSTYFAKAETKFVLRGILLRCTQAKTAQQMASDGERVSAALISFLQQRQLHE
jgi:hypothetical protein